MKQAVFAIGANGEFGKGDTMPWTHNSSDMRNFKKLTENSDLVMGSSTYQTLPFKPTKDRRFIVVTSRPQWKGGENLFFRGLEEVLYFLDHSELNMTVIGGVRMLSPAVLSKLDRLVVTHYHGEFPEADTFIREETTCFIRDNCKMVEIYDKTEDYTTMVYEVIK